jgi:hypothetical protein
MSLVVINGDDFGFSDGVCRALIELLDAGAISNTTVMIAAAHAPARVRQYASHLAGRAGVHLQLSNGSPLSGGPAARTLIDAATRQFRPREETEHSDPAEIEREWRRQIETVTELLGTRPTHLDSHHGVHRLDNCLDIYLGLAAEYNLPVRGGRDIAAQMQAHRVSGSSELIRDWTGRDLGLDALKDRLLAAQRDSRAGEVIEVVAHPGYSDAYLRSASSLSDAREGDLEALATLAEQDWLAENQFVLAAYPHLSG